jgi:hypothetical protein
LLRTVLADPGDVSEENRAVGLEAVTPDPVCFMERGQACQHGTQQQALVCLPADYLAGLRQRRLRDLDEHGIAVSARGRIPASVLEQCRAAAKRR